nr:wnt signaling ligand isoform X1 [Ciona intestinalis]|eukprot:XP_026690559.1 wnt signaling ligand isoform X1 [Ciona intestinalis]
MKLQTLILYLGNPALHNALGRQISCFPRQLLRWTLCLHFAVIGIAAGIQWLSIGKTASISANPSLSLYNGWCTGRAYLTPKQRKICRHHYSMMTSVADAAQIALEECQTQFQSERWNCSTPPHPRRQKRSVFGRELLTGTRELSFVYALSSAAVAYAITRDCRLGKIVGCGCDQTWASRAPLNHTFDWGGCSDNIRWGIEMSKLFVDAQEFERERRNRVKRRRRKKREINERTVNLSNNKFGREVILANMGKRCRCHGISNSCEAMTCWRTLPSFRKVGEILKQSYDNAVQVHVVKKYGRYILRPRNRERHSVGHRFLSFLRMSSDFCATTGRTCEPDETGPNGCDEMCCERGYVIKTRHVTTKCGCTFTWCCNVTCHACNETRIEHVCL